MKVDKAKLEAVRKKHNLSLILLHGSQASGETHPKSDVDIAVVRKDRRVKLELLPTINDLAKALDTDSVDVSDLTNADPLLLRLATKNSKLLAGNKSDYEALLKLAFHRYSDYLPYLKKEEDFVKERIKSYVSA